MYKISILLLSLGLFQTLAAQEQGRDDLPEKENINYGRGLAFNIKESTISTAFTTDEELSHKRSINPSNTLYGLIPGLQVLQNSGYAWGDNATLYIRGLQTLNGNNDPLVLIDGFERKLDYISADEIENVTVLKDAVSTALYGMKGANGVILITTKRGMTSKPKIDFSYQFNLGTPKRLPDFVDGYTYAEALNEGLRNDGLTERYSVRELTAFRDQTYPRVYPDVDWIDESLRDHSYGHRATFSASGGGQFVKYYTQLNYIKDSGIFKPVDDNDGFSTQMKYSRLNIRTNLDIKVSKTTNAKLNVFANFNEQNRPSNNNDEIFGALYQVPAGAFPIKTVGNMFGGTTQYSNNPVALISGSGYTRSQIRTMFADLELIQNLDMVTPGLSLSVRMGVDTYGAYSESNTKEFGMQEVTMNWNTKEPSYRTLNNEGNLSFGSSVGEVNTHYNVEARLNHARNWADGKHRLNSTLLYAMDKNVMKARNATTAFMDVVAQGHYVNNNRYIVDFSLSGSASSILDPDNRWGVFPAVGLGWVMSEEDFLKKDWLNLFKLRASYGVSGRADYSMNLYKSTFGDGTNYVFGQNFESASGMKETRLGVESLTYEKSHKFNFGFDFSAMHKLFVTADVFYDHRTDILVDGDGYVSSVLGIAAPQSNIGIVDNRGIELSARWSDNIGDFKYHIGGTYTFARNKIVEQGEEYRPYDYLKRTGHSVSQIFGYEVVGIYQSQDDIDNREVKQYLGDVKPGDLMFKDQNGDNRIDEYDVVPMGYNSDCPEIYYSFDIGAEYKGIGLYAMFQGAGNYSEILDVASVYRPLVNNNTISKHYYDNRWTKDNPDAIYPRLTYSGSTNNYNTNSLWVADASFLKLRTLELYYQVPQKLLKNLKYLSEMKVFARAHDLLSFDKIDIMDPESVVANHPTMTQYTFGVNLSF